MNQAPRSPAAHAEIARREWDAAFELRCGHHRDRDGLREEGGAIRCGHLACSVAVTRRRGASTTP